MYLTVLVVGARQQEICMLEKDKSKNIYKKTTGLKGTELDIAEVGGRMT